MLGIVLTLTTWSAISLATSDWAPAPEPEQTPPPHEAVLESEPYPESESAPEMLARFIDLYENNSDLVGWIRISGTAVDYPVLRSPDDDWDFYLHHDFYRQPDERGIPYIWPHQDPEESDLLFIYGHHLPDGTQFSDVAKYSDPSYFETHPIIEMSSLYTERNFQVAFAFNVWSNQEYGSYYYHPETGTEGEMPFPYLLHTNWDSQEEFDHFIEQNRAHALYDTGIDISFGERMIALWTCSTTSVNDYRLVVVAVER